MPSVLIKMYIRTPTAEPAVPGAFGIKPAPPAVAMTMAIQSVVVFFTIAVGPVDFFGRALLCGNSIVSSGPLAQIDQFTAFTAKRAIRISAVLGLLVASRTLHDSVSHCRCGLRQSCPKIAAPYVIKPTSFLKKRVSTAESTSFTHYCYRTIEHAYSILPIKSYSRLFVISTV